MNRISVIVFKPEGRPFFQAQWTDPVSGRKKTRSTKTNIKRDAERFVASLEKDLNDGTYHSPRHVAWADFRQRYETEIVPGLAPKTAKKVAAMFNAIETHLRPGRLAGVTGDRLSVFGKALRDKGRSENTIKSHLAHLRAAMNWAHGVGLLVTVPKFRMPSRLKTARHRSVTLEEFERMLAAVPKVVEIDEPDDGAAKTADQIVEDVARVESWSFLLRGLWTSGLRLGEALNLTWDDDRKLRIQMSGRFPMLWIPAELQKNHRTRCCRSPRSSSSCLKWFRWTSEPGPSSIRSDSTGTRAAALPSIGLA